MNYAPEHDTNVALLKDAISVALRSMKFNPKPTNLARIRSHSSSSIDRHVELGSSDVWRESWVPPVYHGQVLNAMSIDASPSISSCKNPFTMGMFTASGLVAPHRDGDGKWRPQRHSSSYFSMERRLDWTNVWSILDERRITPYHARSSIIRKGKLTV